MIFDPTSHMNHILAAQNAADRGRLALIADTLEHLGHGRPTSVSVSWFKGQDSGLPLPNGLTLSGPDGETTTEKDLPEPAYQQLLALLEQQFDPSQDEGDEHFELNSAPDGPDSAAPKAPAGLPDGTPTPPFTLTGSQIQQVGHVVYVTCVLTDAHDQQFAANDSITPLNSLKALEPNRGPSSGVLS